MNTKIILLLVLFLPTLGYSKSEVDVLFDINEQYSICSDVAQSNFKTEQEAFDAIGVFTKEIIKNLNTILDDMLENKKKDGAMNRFVEMVGNKDIVIGHMLNSISQSHEDFNQEKKSLSKELNYDWREVNARLWRKNGCDAIYHNLSAKK